MTEAISLLRSCPEEIEADLAYRGIDVGDWWRGTMSSRRLVLLVKHLPDETATKRAMADDPWPLMTQLLVSVVNEQRMARSDYATVHGDRRVQPNLIPRPGEPAPAEAREHARSMHDALLSMAVPTPENDDARARLRRDMPVAPRVETDDAGG